MSNASSPVLPSQDPRSHLLEALRINAEANRVNAQTIAQLALNASSLHLNSSDPQDRGSQLVEALKINTEATRVSAQALAHLAYHEPKPSGSAPDPQPSSLPQPKCTTKFAKYVINERVGKITTAEWDALSSERIALLVRVLRGIADELSQPLTWDKIGEVIQIRLVEFGFEFLGPGDVDITLDWALVKAKGDDKKLIAAAVLDNNRLNLRKEWYTNEMIRIWSRLIDITDA